VLIDFSTFAVKLIDYYFMKKQYFYILTILLLASCGGGSNQSEKQKEKRMSTTHIVHGSIIELVVPEDEGGNSINEALWARQSSREYSDSPLYLEELSGIMWAAAGVNRPDGHLTAPSALALYPIKTYAFLNQGVYLYNAKENIMERIVEGDYRSLATLQDFANAPSLNIVYIADMSVYDGKDIPEEKKLMLCGMDAAGYAENVNLYAAAYDLKSITRGGAKEKELLELLQLDPARYKFILAQTVGK
jgi:hypothetical protein